LEALLITQISSSRKVCCWDMHSHCIVLFIVHFVKSVFSVCPIFLAVSILAQLRRHSLSNKKQSRAKSGAKSCVKSRANFRLQFKAGVSFFYVFQVFYVASFVCIRLIQRYFSGSYPCCITGHGAFSGVEEKKPSSLG